MAATIGATTMNMILLRRQYRNQRAFANKDKLSTVDPNQNLLYRMRRRVMATCRLCQVRPHHLGPA
jgi:hypothetical protein